MTVAIAADTLSAIPRDARAIRTGQ
jgi:hypothetical protein